MTVCVFFVGQRRVFESAWKYFRVQTCLFVFGCWVFLLFVVLDFGISHKHSKNLKWEQNLNTKLIDLL